MHIIHTFNYSYTAYKNLLGNKIFLYLALTVFVGFFESLGIIMFVPLIDIIINSGNNKSDITEFVISTFSIFDIELNLKTIIFLIIILLTIKGIFLFFAHSINAYLRSIVLAKIKRNLIVSTFEMSYQYFKKHEIGYFTDLIGEQTTKSVQSFSNFSQTFYHGMSIVFYSFLLITISWKLTVSALLIALVIILGFTQLNIYAQNLSRKNVRINNKLIGTIVENLHSFKYLIITNQTEKAVKDAKFQISELARVFNRTARATAITLALREPVSIVFIGSIFFIGSLLGDILLTDTITVVLIVYRASSSLFALQYYWQNMLNHIGGLDVVQAELLSLAKNKNVNIGTHDFTFKNSIDFKNVKFTHEEAERATFTDLSLTLKAGNMITLLGASGSGKSTIIELLSNLMDIQGGYIKIDDVFLSDIDLTLMRQRIGYVSQECSLYDGSILDNIVGENLSMDTLVKESSSIEKCLKISECSDFVSKMPNGLASKVGEGGHLLSNGQRQRLLIARELYRKPAILILDEATNALDSSTMQKVYLNLKSIDWPCTIIVVSHQVFPAKISDDVYIIGDSTVVASGGYQILRKSDDEIVKAALSNDG